MSTAVMPAPALNPDEAWAAVQSRDPAAELVYAVVTTGVFCRPACPSRRPDRANVRFFPNPAAAQRAGFRPCRRCRPLHRHADASLVETLAAALRVERPVRLTELARLAGPAASPFTVQRTFQRLLGVTPAQYQRQQRAASFRRELAAGQARVTDAIYDAGYSGPGRAYEGSQLGMAPGQFRSGGRGAHIGYAAAACPLGRLLVAATERGLCSVILGNSDRELIAQLRAQFPHAEIHPNAQLRPMLRQVLTQFTPHPAALDLPLDLRATAFQMRVWEALRRIPRGETRSYAQLARSLGNPKAVRAVASACSANRIAVVIPCHRVIGSDGSLTGYRWGVGRKKKLLDIEKRSPSA
ncbi:MAG TPA: bifunctional DNA-binding transcriptional regulator/O6-methylguanine-DNA methyltransferase Ada [Acidobacteriaceae bacterium]|nr:bifunctional DNA-binding transcriptional regulator/O6-methylguanine-DNA methyltransferase Ada [Acidobacteriaceae bacterium]